MVKAIFFDFDGTLFSHKSGEISASTRTALAELRKRNIRSVLATGRHMLEMEELPVNDLSFDGYITLNGQLCLDEKKKLFLGKTIEGAEKEYQIYSTTGSLLYRGTDAEVALPRGIYVVRYGNAIEKVVL